jgi:hypothetical protein
LQELTTLGIRGTKATDASADWLKAALPDLKVER